MRGGGLDVSGIMPPAEGDGTSRTRRSGDAHLNQLLGVLEGFRRELVATQHAPDFAGAGNGVQFLDDRNRAAAALLLSTR
jgi:hypothetical protein